MSAVESSTKPNKKERKSKREKSGEKRSRKSKKSTEETKTVESVPTPAPAPTPEPVKTVETVVVPESAPAPAVAGENPCAELVVKFEGVIKELQARIDADKALLATTKSLLKDVQKHHKTMAKSMGGKKRQRKAPADGEKRPSGFTKPTKISNELCDFLGVSHGSEFARTDVTKKITEYVKEHKLQSSEDGRQINPDKKLKALLNSGDDKVTFFTLQRYMKHHYVKA